VIFLFFDIDIVCISESGEKPKMTSVSQTVRASSGVSAHVQVEYVPEKSETEVACQCKIAQTVKKMSTKCFGWLATVAQLFQACV
jgi:phage tail tube protein FII